MMALWMLYVVAISAVVALMGAVGEHALRAVRAPSRWIWLGAIVAAIGFPVLRLLGVGAPSAPLVPPDPPVFGVGTSTAIDLSLTPGLFTPETLAFLNLPLALAWFAVSAVLIVWLGTLSLRLQRQSRAWPQRHMAGVQVRIAPSTGPAVIGIGKSTIVLPTWIDDLPEEDRAAVLRHELEHVRSSDHAVILSALLGTVLMPWNLPLWWMARRLRHAIEVDCDARVVAAGVARRRYGEILLEISQRHTRSRVLGTALASDASLLSRRISMMEPTPVKSSRLRLMGGAAVAALLAVAACETPAPPAIVDHPNVSTASEVDQSPVRLSSPMLRYPEMLRQAGVEGEVVLSFIVTADGTVDEESIEIVSSTNRAFEGPSRHTIAGSRFEPATIRGEPVAVRIQQRVTFAQDANADGDVRVRATPTDTQLVYVREGQNGEPERPLILMVDGDEISRIQGPATLGPETPIMTSDGRRILALSDLDPDQVERIEVIKGSAARTQFGADGANGVIKIFLKPEVN